MDSFTKEEEPKAQRTFLEYYKNKRYLTFFEGACLVNNACPDLTRSQSYHKWQCENQELDAIDPYTFKRMFDGLIVFFLPDDIAKTIAKLKKNIEHPLQTPFPENYVKKILSSISNPLDFERVENRAPSKVPEKRRAEHTNPVFISTPLNSPTFDRLQRAIAAFPDRYPDYGIKFPKMEPDVRPWLKYAGLATNDREARVFGTILSEYFNVLPDTPAP